ncbi:MAG TPA: aspartyl-phosphate phosphatase Spo0E family protein [Bacillales bacterium]
MEKRELQLEIEKSRTEMNQIAKHHSLYSKKMLAISRRLDCLLNQYQKNISY